MGYTKVVTVETDLLRGVVDALPVGLAVVDTAGHFQLINPAAQRILGGITGDGATGTSDGPGGGYTLHRLDRSEFPHDDLPLVRALEHGESVDNAEVLLRRADATEATLLISARPLRDDKGAITGGLAMVIDVTARQHAEIARARAKDEFLATVSHELRTPLNSIVGWAHMLKQRVLDEATAAKALDTIIRNANMQARLVNDLLDTSRIVSGHLRLDIQETELIPVIESALETLKPAAEIKGIHVLRALDPKAEPILGDPARMQQVVWNLVSNAIKFTPQGGEIFVRLERAGRHVRVIVRDTGRGMSPQLLPFVFDRFRQGPRGSTETHSGVGLGLAIVRHIVELHGGTVEAHSAGEGQGSEFVVTLPWWNPKELQPASETDGRAAPADLKGMHVLLVEDEADPRELITTMLRAFNAKVHAVATADEALAAITTAPPDVLVSDIRLEEVDGYALIREVRALPPDQGGNVPAIALTALTRQEDHRRALDAGYQVHVPKPVTPAKLVAVLGFLLRQKGPAPP